MRRPLAVVIEDDSDEREIFKQFLLGNPLGFDVRTFETLPENLDEVKDATLFLIDYRLPNLNGIEISRKLGEKGFLGAKVMITGHADQEMMRVSLKERLWDGWLEKPIRLSDLDEQILELREENKLSQKLNVGIVGLGSLGTSLYKRLLSFPFVDTAHIFSNFTKDDYSSFLGLLENPQKAIQSDFNVILNEIPEEFLDKIKELEKNNKVIAHKGNKGLETLVRANPDILFVTTGKYNALYPDREKLYKESIKKVEPIFEVLRDAYYQGLIFLGTNPIGPLLKIGKYCGLDANKLTGFSPDIRRAKDLILGYIHKIEDEDAKIEDLQILTALEHGKELILFDNSFSKGIPLCEKYTFFKDSKIREEIISSLHRIGLEAMLASRDLEINYMGTPDAGARIVNDLAHFKKSPGDFVYSYLGDDFIPGLDSFFGWPVNIDYMPFKIYRDPSFNIENLDGSVIREIVKQATEQEILFQNAYLMED